jgi:hypothetical protein
MFEPSLLLFAVGIYASISDVNAFSDSQILNDNLEMDMPWKNFWHTPEFRSLIFDEYCTDDFLEVWMMLFIYNHVSNQPDQKNIKYNKDKESDCVWSSNEILGSYNQSSLYNKTASFDII